MLVLCLRNPGQTVKRNGITNRQDFHSFFFFHNSAYNSDNHVLNERNPHHELLESPCIYLSNHRMEYQSLPPLVGCKLHYPYTKLFSNAPIQNL